MNEAKLSAWPMTTESARGPAKSGPVVLLFFKTKPQLNKKNNVSSALFYDASSILRFRPLWWLEN